MENNLHPISEISKLVRDCTMFDLKPDVFDQTFSDVNKWLEFNVYILDIFEDSLNKMPK